MALADWDIQGGGSYSIITGTGLGTDTPTSVISIPSQTNPLRLLNNTAGNIENSQIETWARYEFDTNQGRDGFQLRLRGQNNGNNAAYVGYHVLVNAQTNTSFSFRLFSTLAGTATNLANSAYTPASPSDLMLFQRYRFTVVTSGGINYLRLEVKVSGSYVVFLECADTNTSMSIAGKGGIVSHSNVFTTLTLDDTKIYSLA